MTSDLLKNRWMGIHSSLVWWIGRQSVCLHLTAHSGLCPCPLCMGWADTDRSSTWSEDRSSAEQSQSMWKKSQEWDCNLFIWTFHTCMRGQVTNTDRQLRFLYLLIFTHLYAVHDYTSVCTSTLKTMSCNKSGKNKMPECLKRLSLTATGLKVALKWL